MEKQMKAAAIYARVSSDKQKEEKTIASQTAALTEFARKEGYDVPREWIFEDEGFSGASLVRPGLERLRDLAAEGQLEAILVYSPDRLSRKYAYQILLTEEFARNGVETVFVKAPKSDSPEDQLLLQFQGMIAEYERAQILERSRRGKRHRARQGQVSVLSGAPYGYRYVRKSEETAAYYEVMEAEADVVRLIYRRYTMEHLSIGTITRLLNEQAVPTRKRISRWERSTVWAILRNPAYKGTACFGKTEMRPRQRMTRTLRMRGGIAKRNSSNQERPRKDWIEIPVPAIVSGETFALAQELLTANKMNAPRRTIQPSVCQGMLACSKCGYALYRTSTRTSSRKIYYYRCFGSDRWRYLKGAVCNNPPIREELLDQVVWNETVRLLENPNLIQDELNRRLDAAQKSSPTKRRQESLQRDLTRARKSIERLMTAYQEELLSLDELRSRMPDLRQRERAMQAELQSIATQAQDRAAYLRLAETLSAFLSRLRSTAKTLDITERQRIVRLLVKEVIVSEDAITIRHSVPITFPPRDDESPKSGRSEASKSQGYLLRSGRHYSSLRRPRHARNDAAILHLHRRLQPAFDVEQNPTAIRMLADRLEHQLPINTVEVGLHVEVKYPVVAPTAPASSAHRLDCRLAGPVTVGIGMKHPLQNRLQVTAGYFLGDSVGDSWNTQRPNAPTISLRNFNPPHRRRKVTPRRQPVPEFVEVVL
jgi:site-specific DNA recombinase